jgi:hypothetical protein
LNILSFLNQLTTCLFLLKTLNNMEKVTSMTDKEAMKLALVALETLMIERGSIYDKAITAIKEALAQPEQEPLAHWSDCAVHSEPAYPKSECDCGGIVAVADYTALSDKYVALSDKYVALKAQHKEQEPVAWLLTDKNINSLQVDSIQRLINRLNHAHHTDLCVRINGQDEWFQADWLKHMVRATPPQRTWIGLTEKDWNRSKHNYDFQKGVDWAESILKEKNT